jgi:ketosteroid isomerase-like protein
VVIARLVGRGKASGVTVERTWAYVWTLREQRILRMDGYENRREALEAVGLAD